MNRKTMSAWLDEYFLLVALAACIRGIIDRDGHGQGRWIDRLGVDSFLHCGIAQRVGDRGGFQTGNGDDVARLGALHRHPRQAAKRQQLGDAGLFDDLAVAVQHLDVAVGGDDAGFDAARQHPPQIIVGFQSGDQHLEGMLIAGQLLRLGRRHVIHDQLE